jgi:hypothetical protein
MPGRVAGIKCDGARDQFDGARDIAVLGRNHAEQEPGFRGVTIIGQDLKACLVGSAEVPGREGAPRNAAQRFVRS